MDSTGLFKILSGLIKPRDFLFIGLPMIGTFIIESINENFIYFLESGHSAVIAGGIGLLANKLFECTYIKKRKNSFAIKAAKNYIIYISERLASNEPMNRKESKTLLTKAEMLQTVLHKYDKKIIKSEDFRQIVRKITLEE